mmetsp:Transcript_10702/g.26769  ORF Transcript_10702/g.26769 Transcript_10702/m.26769 type:complete len:424 (-) Transcript_10702:384-1655(-)
MDCGRAAAGRREVQGSIDRGAVADGCGRGAAPAAAAGQAAIAAAAAAAAAAADADASKTGARLRDRGPGDSGHAPFEFEVAEKLPAVWCPPEVPGRPPMPREDALDLGRALCEAPELGANGGVVALAGLPLPQLPSVANHGSTLHARQGSDTALVFGAAATEAHRRFLLLLSPPPSTCSTCRIVQTAQASIVCWHPLRLSRRAQHRALAHDAHRILDVHARRQQEWRDDRRHHRRHRIAGGVLREFVAHVLRVRLNGVPVRADTLYPKHMQVPATRQHLVLKGILALRTVQLEILEEHLVERRPGTQHVERHRQGGGGQDAVRIAVEQVRVDQGELQEEVCEYRAFDVPRLQPSAETVQEVVHGRRADAEPELAEHDHLGIEHFRKGHPVAPQVGHHLAQGEFQVLCRAHLQSQANCGQQLAL